MRIPESKIEQIRTSADIVDVVSQYVQLRKRGKNYIGLCPFHNEKTPSFTVSSEKQLFKCFGCGAGGSVITFLMDIKKISYVEAIQELADMLGIPIEYETNVDSETLTETEQMYELNTEVARFFSESLLSSNEGEFARQYFSNRKIKTSSLRAFGLGFAPQKGKLIEFLNSKKLDLNLAVTLGLLIKNDDGSFYERFSGRIIFPIFSPNGRVIAFAGRILEAKENTAKYLNSPESKIYFKSKVLYGLSHAKDEIRKTGKAILVEGYMDLISLHQSGIKNVVAVSGTSFTDEQAQLLSRYCKEIILLFDSDKAGISAALRSFEILLKYDFSISVIELPEGEDPDSFILKNGKKEFENLVNEAIGFIEYQTSIFKKNGDLDNPDKSANAINELVRLLSLVKDEIKRSLLLQAVAQKFNLRVRLLEDKLESLSRKAAKVEFREVKDEKSHSTILTDNKKLESDKVVLKIEEDLFKIMFEYDTTGKIILSEITPEEFQNENHRKLAEQVLNSIEEIGYCDASKILESVDDEEIKNLILRYSIDKHKISERWKEFYPKVTEFKVEKAIYDLIKQFKFLKIDDKISHLNNKIKELNDDEGFLILREVRDLINYKKEIEKKYSALV